MKPTRDGEGVDVNMTSENLSSQKAHPMTHPERVVEHAMNCEINEGLSENCTCEFCEHDLPARESACAGGMCPLCLATALTASEKRASEAERTFADLRNLIEKNLVVMADLVRERTQILAALVRADQKVIDVASERDSARAALGRVVEAEREDCARVADAEAEGAHPEAPSCTVGRRIAKAIRARTALTHTGNSD